MKEALTAEDETQCPCPNISCELHGDCAACFDYHAALHEASFCLELEIRKSKVCAKLDAAETVPDGLQ